ncbi:MAG: hypothetical protein SGJ17_05715 [Hyphomicrobiales bacterium]|nr:hypothetical protein [Hyphomicrobiales bacterium]
MATKLAPRKPPGEPKSSSIVATLVAFVLVTILAAAGGVLLGPQIADAGRVTVQEGVPAPAGRAPRQHQLNSATLVPLSPIVVSLAGTKKIWMRLEASIVLEGRPSDAPLLAAKVGEDILAFLKTVTLAQIEGASGFMFLRDDLNDRVRLRSDDKIRELVIRTFAIE